MKVCEGCYEANHRFTVYLFDGLHQPGHVRAGRGTCHGGEQSDDSGPAVRKWSCCRQYRRRRTGCRQSRRGGGDGGASRHRRRSPDRGPVRGPDGSLHRPGDFRKRCGHQAEPGQRHQSHDPDSDIRRPGIRQNQDDGRGGDKRPRQVYGRLPGLSGGGGGPDRGNAHQVYRGGLRQ